LCRVCEPKVIDRPRRTHTQTHELRTTNGSGLPYKLACRWLGFEGLGSHTHTHTHTQHKQRHRQTKTNTHTHTNNTSTEPPTAQRPVVISHVCGWDAEGLGSHTHATQTKSHIDKDEHTQAQAHEHRTTNDATTSCKLACRWLGPRGAVCVVCVSPK